MPTSQALDECVQSLLKSTRAFWPRLESANDPPSHAIGEAFDRLIHWVPVVASTLRAEWDDGEISIKEACIEAWTVLARELLHRVEQPCDEWTPDQRAVRELRLAFHDLRHQATRRSQEHPYLPRTIPFRHDPFWPNESATAPELPAIVDSTGWESLPYRGDSLAMDSLDFGDEPWGRGARNWLAADHDSFEGARRCVQANAPYPCIIKVFRFRGQFVGFASLQLTRWQIGDSLVRVAVIPWIAIARCWWGISHPEEPKSRFVDLALRELIEFAQAEQVPLGLFVADENLRAKSLYARHGFQSIGPPRFDRNDGSFRERWVRKTAAEQSRVAALP